MNQLWEILVPVTDNFGIPFEVKHHQLWDGEIRNRTGGLTILRSAKGHWFDKDDNVFVKEEMIPVRIVCNEKDMESIANYTAAFYQQKAIMYYRISDCVVIKNY